MHTRIADLINTSPRPLVSVEFFPPKTVQGNRTLCKIVQELSDRESHRSLDYVSVTQRTGGIAGNITQNLVIEIAELIPVVAHITCVGSRSEDMHDLINEYQKRNIFNVLALRGDLDVAEQNYKDFIYARDLVSFIRTSFPELGIGVAGFPEGHPECQNRLHEIKYLKQKIDAGAHYIVTQLFFDNRSFFDFAERCRFFGINVPITAGIFPITSLERMERMTDLAAGTNIPAKLLKKIFSYEKAEDIAAVGIEWACRQAEELYAAGFPLHFYSLNNKTVSLQLLDAVG